MPYSIHFSISEQEGILKVTVQTTALQMTTQKVNTGEIGLNNNHHPPPPPLDLD